MAKPSRRERRRLAEQGKNVARRAAPATLPHGAGVEPRERVAAPMLETAAEPSARATGAKPGEYAHVKADLVRIAVLATALFGGMIALRFILPQ